MVESGSRKAAFRAVVFDLDGTLLNTLEDIGNAMNCVLLQHGYARHPVDAYREFVGNGAAMLVKRSLPPGDYSDRELGVCLDEFRTEYGRTWDECTRPYPGIAAMLDGLETRKVPKAVLSNKPHDFTRRCVMKLLEKWEFHPVIGQREGRPSKPDPQSALEIARALGIDSAEILYVGDSAVDMHTAAAAGMKPVGVRWGFRSAEELTRAGAACLLSEPGELLSLL